MHFGIPAETRPGETRVAATPETIKKLLTGGKHAVTVQAGAGAGASIPDADFEAAGATIAASAADVYAKADMILKVRSPLPEETAMLRRDQVIAGMLNRFDAAGLEAIARTGATAFAMEAAPRITRAQSLDVLSSQANLGGYKAVLVAANHYKKMFPMMMTAAGTVKAARVVIMGVGVAGLQAIATARRLGAVVEATDVRPATKEQVESLGAKFIDVPFETDEEREIAQGAGGYARPMPEAWMKRQAALVAERIRQADIVITTALIPGRPAPVLVTEDMVKSMKPGSVIVDMAAGQGAAANGAAHGGGNCPLTEKDAVVVKHGVTLVGHTNYPAMVAADASSLYARNLLDFLKLVIDKEGAFTLNLEDEIVAACCVARGGELTRKG